MAHPHDVFRQPLDVEANVDAGVHALQPGVGSRRQVSSAVRAAVNFLSTATSLGPRGSSRQAETARNANIAALRAILSSRIAWLLLFVPTAMFAACLGETVDAAKHFLLNFCAIIPLAWLISEGTEHLERRIGAAAGALINSSFGNVVEIILSISAIREGLVKVVQAALLGSILMNLLFVLGCCFLVSGVKSPSGSHRFNHNSASYNLGLLAVSCLGLIVPTGLAATDEYSLAEERVAISRAVAVLLATMYAQWIFFTLSTHPSLFKSSPAPEAEQLVAGNKQASAVDGHASLHAAELRVTAMQDQEEQGDDSNAHHQAEESTLSVGAAAALLLTATVVVSFHCDWLVASINPVAEEMHVKKAFIATVLLPVVGNISEEIAAINIALKGKLDLAMTVAIGAATQVALLAVPVAVFIAWTMQVPLDLDFEVFQVQLLVASILVVALCLADGHSNWLKGSMLVTCYVIVAISFWFIHDREFASGGLPPVPVDRPAD